MPTTTAGRHVGERVRNVRESAGMSRTRLADVSGVSLRTLARLELGEGLPQLATLQSIAEALRVNIADLLDGAS